MRFFLFSAASSMIRRDDLGTTVDVHEELIDDLVRRDSAQGLCKGGQQCTFEEVCKDPGADAWMMWQKAAASLHVQGEQGTTVDVREELGSLKLLGKVGGGLSGSAMMMSSTERLFLKSLDVKSGKQVLRLAEEYYEHILYSPASFLTTIGMCELKDTFKVGKKGDMHKYLLIMTNLREHSGITQSFDLKGSKWKNLAKDKTRRCDDDFVRKVESGETAEGEDVDFVSMRSPVYRHSVANVDNHKCWPEESAAQRSEAAYSRALALGGSARQTYNVQERYASEAAVNAALGGRRDNFPPSHFPVRNETKELAGTPMYLPAVQHAAFSAQLKRDVAFLRKHGMMDYSLVVNVIATDGTACPTDSYNLFPVVQEKQQIVVGIIDFYTKYSWYKSGSNFAQSVLGMFGKKSSKYKEGEPVGYDTVDEEDYAVRFQRFFQRWIRSCKTGPDFVESDACCAAP